MARRSVRVTVFVVAAALVAAGGVIGFRKIWDVAQQHFSNPHCTIGAYELDLEQASVASTMVGAVSKFVPALPERAAILALAAGLQESKLRNLALGEGDRDSVGVLQQRPSQGWGGGDPKVLNNVGEATREFLNALVKVPGWRAKSLADAVQAVQISADGSAYAKHEDEATVLAGALRGDRPAAVTCTFDKPTVVASAAKVASQVREQLPVKNVTVSGRTVRVPGAGWQTAAWFIANADRLGIDRVAFAGRSWSRADGWTTGTADRSAVVATMAQLG